MGLLGHNPIISWRESVCFIHVCILEMCTLFLGANAAIKKGEEGMGERVEGRL